MPKSYDVGPLLDVSPNTLHLHIVKQFRQMVHDGIFVEGGRMPSERELAAMLGVSRIPLRESLKVLEFLGIIRRIRGREMTLGQLDLAQVMEFFDFLIANPLHTLEELFETREGLECQAAMLAARRRTDEDLDAIAQALEVMKRFTATGLADVEPNLHYHRLIVGAAHNRVLMRACESMSELFTFSRKEILADKERLETELDHHKTIFRRIRDQDEEGAARAMREHMRSALANARKRHLFSLPEQGEEETRTP